MPGWRIEVKNNDILLNELLAVEVHPTMLGLLKWLNDQVDGVTITGGYESIIIRPKGGVHTTKPLRGIDIRSRIYTNPQKIVDIINAYWTYDPNRLYLKCAIYHNTGRGDHIHLQVHNNTEMKQWKMQNVGNVNM